MHMSTQLPIVILLLKIVVLCRNGWKDDANVLKMAPQQPCIKYSLWWLNVGHVKTWPSWMSTDIWRGFLMPVQEMSAQNTLLTPVKGPENLRISEKGISSNSYVTSVNQTCPGLSLRTETELYRRFLSVLWNSLIPREKYPHPDSCLEVVWPEFSPKLDIEVLTPVIPTQISLR